MTNQEIEEMIKSHIPNMRKPFIGIKIWKEEPKDVPKYEGTVFPGICTQIAEVLMTGRGTFYTTPDQHFCTAGLMATGVRPRMTDEEFAEVTKTHLVMSKDSKDFETARRYYRVESEKLCPIPTEKNAGVQVGLFKDVKDADIVLIFCTPYQGDVINRAYAYSLGEVIIGYGSHSGCPFILGGPYVLKEPNFTVGDIEWRGYVGLDDDEITFAFPYQSILRFLDDFPEAADDYNERFRMIRSLLYSPPKTPPMGKWKDKKMQHE
jgi:uncharacterized protein (DUF169 family)